MFLLGDPVGPDTPGRPIYYDKYAGTIPTRDLSYDPIADRRLSSRSTESLSLPPSTIF